MEKPFLEHLEDLRVMITQIVVTLVLSSVVCFMFQGHVMRVLRKPVDEVWNTHMQETLPKDISIEKWERAKSVFDHALVLDPDERATFFERFDEETRGLITAVKYMRASKALPEAEREEYLKETAGIDKALLDLIARLNETGADADRLGTPNLSMMSALKPTETFLLSMKLAIFAGVVVSFPLLLYFILRFVLPGLKENEQRVLWPSLAIGFGLFLVGVLFAYFAVLPRALVFFFQWDQSLNVGSDWRIGWYIGFATQFTLLFGFAFELPVVIMALVKIGILNHEMMSRTRRYAVVAILILAAVITPTGDPITLMMLTIPMYLLYEMCIWLAWFDDKKRREREAEEEKEHMARLLADPDINPDAADLEAGEGAEEEDRGDDDPGPLYEEENREDEANDGDPDAPDSDGDRRSDS